MKGRTGRPPPSSAHSVAARRRKPARVRSSDASRLPRRQRRAVLTQLPLPEIDMSAVARSNKARGRRDSAAESLVGKPKPGCPNSQNASAVEARLVQSVQCRQGLASTVPILPQKRPPCPDPFRGRAAHDRRPAARQQARAALRGDSSDRSNGQPVSSNVSGGHRQHVAGELSARDEQIPALRSPAIDLRVARATSAPKGFSESFDEHRRSFHHCGASVGVGAVIAAEETGSVLGRVEGVDQ